MAQYKTFLEWIGGMDAITNCVVMKYPLGIFGMPITFEDFTEYKKYIMMKNDLMLRKDILLDISIFSPLNQMTAISDLSPYFDIPQFEYQKIMNHAAELKELTTVTVPLKFENNLHLTFGDFTD